MYLPRELERPLAEWMKRKEAIIIKGPRQSGKTTLLKHLHSLYGGTYVNLEIPSKREMLERYPLSFAEYEEPLYFDEVSNVPGCGKKLKLLYDEKEVKMVISGSGAFEVKENISGALVGRAVSFELLPLSFGEFLMWRWNEVYELYEEANREIKLLFEEGKIPSGLPESEEIIGAYDEYTRWGGYPRVVLEKKEKGFVLSNIVKSALERDVFQFFEIREKRKFEEFLSLLAARAGSMLHLSSLGIPYRTAERYVDVLAMEYFIDLVFPFHKNLATELRKTPKLYFIDLGVLNLLAGFRVSEAVLMENFVFSQLRRLGNLFYWRTESKAEVDFILNGIPIEVKSGKKDNFSRSFLSFLKHYEPSVGVVVTKGGYKVRKVGGTEVVFLPVWWL